MATILCVAGDRYLTDLLRYALAREGFAVRMAHTGRDALRLMRCESLDLIILDVDLPDMNGLGVLSSLRAFSQIPVVMLTARSQDEDIIAGFGQGADDYVAKPFSVQVLVNRVKAVLRRARRQTEPLPAGAATYQIRGALFDPERNEIVGHDVRIKLTPTESHILHLLLLHEGRVLSAERIMERIWGYDSGSDVDVIKTHIRHLREKISNLPNSPLREKLSSLLAPPEQWPTGSPNQIPGKGVREGSLMARILCVDDDRHLVDLLARALEREGFVVLAAHNGWDALRLAWGERPDLVVLDANMPDVNGFDVLPMLRSFSRVPVIMLTGGADNEDRRADLIGRARFVRGADDYVAKPFSPDVLIGRIRALLRERPPPR